MQKEKEESQLYEEDHRAIESDADNLFYEASICVLAEGGVPYVLPAAWFAFCSNYHSNVGYEAGLQPGLVAAARLYCCLQITNAAMQVSGFLVSDYCVLSQDFRVPQTVIPSFRPLYMKFCIEANEKEGNGERKKNCRNNIYLV